MTNTNYIALFTLQKYLALMWDLKKLIADVFIV